VQTRRLRSRISRIFPSWEKIRCSTHTTAVSGACRTPTSLAQSRGVVAHGFRPIPPCCVMSTFRQRARAIDEVYGPGFHYRTSPLPLGAYLARIHTRVRIRLPPPERGIVYLFALTKGLRQKAKGLCRYQRLSESRFAGRCGKQQNARHLGHTRSSSRLQANLR
jgi:hypothetical protein